MKYMNKNVERSFTVKYTFSAVSVDYKNVNVYINMYQVNKLYILQ